MLEYNFLAGLILAVVQGVSEWLPISSSGHLVVGEWLLGYNADFVFEVVVHLGTLMAVFVYYGRDIVSIVRDVLHGRLGSEYGRLGILVGVATIPAAIIGFLFRSVFEFAFEHLGVVALGFGVSALVLFIASRDFEDQKPFQRRVFGYREALIVGIAQVFALFPGISRSGMTIAAGLLAGLKEKEALRFSFLMSIPVIFGANVLVIGTRSLPPQYVWATLVSFIVGMATIHLLLRYFLKDKKNLWWFGVYVGILAFFVGGIFLYDFLSS